MDIEKKNGKKVEDIYNKYRNPNPEKLIREICKNKKTGPWKLFGKQTWQDFKWAVKYRNLLIHEATFLQQGVAIRLIKETENIISILEKLL